jgi:alkylhydroperoxidase/carboxymuconolactone decarboxylase family protein YurZ
VVSRALDEKTKKLVGLAVAYAIQEPYCITDP